MAEDIPEGVTPEVNAAEEETQAISEPVSKGKEKVDSTTEVDAMIKDEVQFCVSYEAIKLGVRPLRRPGSEAREDGGSTGEKKTKTSNDRANYLLTKPLKLKPSHSGTKVVGCSVKEIGNRVRAISELLSTFVGEGSSSGPERGSNVKFGPTNPGSSPSRPPDPTLAPPG